MGTIGLALDTVLADTPKREFTVPAPAIAPDPATARVARLLVDRRCIVAFPARIQKPSSARCFVWLTPEFSCC